MQYTNQRISPKPASRTQRGGVITRTLALAFLSVCVAGSVAFASGLGPSPPRRSMEGLVEFTRGLITVVAPEALRSEASTLTGLGAELLPRLEQDLRQTLAGPLTMVLLPKKVPSILQELDRHGPTWATGFMLPVQRVGVIRMHRVTNYPFNSSEMVLAHEISHLLVHDKVGRNVPRWFDEAVATREGRRHGIRDSLRFTSSTALSRVLSRVPSLASLDRAFNGSEKQVSRAYLVSFEFLNWAVKRHGPDLVANLLDATAHYNVQARTSLDARTNFEAAWQDVTGSPLIISEQRWRQRTLRITRWLPIILSSNTLWIAMAILTFVAFLSRRRRTLEQYERWEEEELLAARSLDPRPTALSPPTLLPVENGEDIAEDHGDDHGEDNEDLPVN